jgi:prevent-host-death family protein
MTRLVGQHPDRWALQDAKSRLSELIRVVQQRGPQRVTVHGRDVAVVMSVDEFDRLTGNRTGADLVAACQKISDIELDLTAPSVRSPVRDVEF